MGGRHVQLPVVAPELAKVTVASCDDKSKETASPKQVVPPAGLQIDETIDILALD